MTMRLRAGRHPVPTSATWRFSLSPWATRGSGSYSAPLWEDPFTHLALAAQRTSRIGLSTAVLIPDERSKMSMAAAISTIAGLSGGRFRACFGTGATARRTMGQRPMTMRALEDYVTAVRGLLAGETVTIDGQPARMLHADGLTAPRPVDVELWLSVFGPRVSNSPPGSATESSGCQCGTHFPSPR
jgi:alkanesulfonate monooxygenase SsuD/methylene tetrahydromethanopterin reductase-like flavin-dependent oxidoreductase (luciferase family)